MRVQCPICDQSYDLDGKMIGRKARCKNCREIFTVEPVVEVEEPDNVEPPPPPQPIHSPAANDGLRAPVVRSRLVLGCGCALLAALAYSAHSSFRQLELLDRIGQRNEAARTYNLQGLTDDEITERLRSAGIWVSDFEIEANDRREATAGLMTVGLWVLFFILLLVWKYRAYKNLDSLGASGLRFSAAGAVGWYFCPILNLWKPCQVMQDIYIGSHPKGLGRGHEVGAGLVALWWAVWLIDGFVSALLDSAYGSAMTVDGMVALTRADLGIIAFSVLAAVMTMTVVYVVSRNQVQRAAMLTGRTTFGPADVPNPYARLQG